MRKTYMKPVMESEMFVANEYVATCWKVICKGLSNTLRLDHEEHGVVANKLTEEPVILSIDVWTNGQTVNMYYDSNNDFHRDVEVLSSDTSNMS